MHVLKKGSPRSPQLIDIPSLALSPVAPVLFNLSEPAKIKKYLYCVVKKL